MRDPAAAAGHPTGVASITGWDGLVHEAATPVPARQPEQRTRARILTAALPTSPASTA